MWQNTFLHRLALLLFISEILSLSPSDASMINCASTCSNGNVYLIIPSEMITQDKAPIDALKSKNEFSRTIFSVQVLADLEISINVRLNSTDNATNGITATISAKLKPSYVRRNELKPLVLYFNSTSVCVLFENECSFECSKIPSVISDLSSFFTTDSSISIDDNIAFTNNRTSVYLSADNCTNILFADENFVNGLN